MKMKDIIQLKEKVILCALILRQLEKDIFLINLKHLLNGVNAMKNVPLVILRVMQIKCFVILVKQI